MTLRVSMSEGIVGPVVIERTDSRRSVSVVGEVLKGRVLHEVKDVEEERKVLRCVLDALAEFREDVGVHGTLRRLNVLEQLFDLLSDVSSISQTTLRVLPDVHDELDLVCDLHLVGDGIDDEWNINVDTHYYLLMMFFVCTKK
jgi:hypothetical protein